MLKIVGLGANDLNHLTMAAFKSLKQADKIYLRTEKHPVVNDLKQEGISYQSFDYLYQQADDFAEVYQKISEKIISLDFQTNDIVYAVPGHPMVAEDSVKMIIESIKDYKMIAAPSFVDLIFSCLEIDPIRGFALLDGLDFKIRDINPDFPVVIAQVYNRNIASKIKLELMKKYDDSFQVYLLDFLGSKKEKIKKLELYKIDRFDWLGPLTTLYLPADNDNNKNFNKLLKIMERLRSENGCPWDREQTHQSIKSNVIEEAYEVVDRIEEKDYFGLAEELGDLLLQVVFQAQIASEKASFNIYHVIKEICQKLIRRHPHVFADEIIDDSKQVVARWDDIKAKEKPKKNKSLLDDVARNFTALLEAQKLQKKAAKVGFDWNEIANVVAKVKEELLEFETAYQEDDLVAIAEELGDLLFSIVNLARFFEFEGELLLKKTNKKFRKRFSKMEELASKQGQTLTELSLTQLENLWQEAKNK